MHSLWGMGQMIPPCGTKYIVAVDDDVDMHNTSEVLFLLCANTDPQRDSKVAVRKDSPKARPTCSTTRRAKSRWEQSWALTQRASSRVKDSKDRGRR